jgi:uncharacterized membrane protein
MKLNFLSSWAMTLRRLSRKLWLRVSFFALLSVGTAVLALLARNMIPATLQRSFVPEAVLPILTILASGMLAVSTFSLNVMVTAHNAAAGQSTPRVHRILLADTTTHTVLAVFIGAFVYALSAIILFKAGLYPEEASVLVLIVTVAVVVLVILALLRWIHHLSDLGSMDATLATIERSTRPCLMHARAVPALGAGILRRDMVLPDEARPILAPATGHVQFIDMAGLQNLCTGTRAPLYLYTRPGDYVVKGGVIGHAAGHDDAALERVGAHLTIGAHRTFEQDAGYGLLVLSETAARALSPGINDPGTAIAVICRLENLLLDWAHARPEIEAPLFAGVFLPDTSRTELIENAFGQTARDGAGKIEVAERLRAALLRLSAAPDPALAGAARAMATRALDHAEGALPLASERARLHATGDGISFLP